MILTNASTRANAFCFSVAAVENVTDNTDLAISDWVTKYHNTQVLLNKSKMCFKFQVHIAARDYSCFNI